MKINSRIEIEFSGITLPVVRDANEREVVPLKPISDVFGLKWEKQREKFASIDDTCTPPKGGAGSENPPISDISGGAIPPAASAISRRFGACLAMVPFAGQSREMLCIRLDRVEAFINQIDPDRVRGNGNETGADFLEAKQSEWDDVLHDYEEIGIAINLNHAKAQEALRKQRASFAQMMGVKNKTPGREDRRAINHVLQQMASELGVPYSPDLADQG